MNESTTLRNAELATEIVSAFVSRNSVPVATLPTLISEVHASLERLAKGALRRDYPRAGANTCRAGEEVCDR